MAAQDGVSPTGRPRLSLGAGRLHETGALRLHPRCYYRTETWPAMIAAGPDLGGVQTGAHHTWLLPDGSDKASVEIPRRAMGHLLGHAVRFGVAQDVLAAGVIVFPGTSIQENLADKARKLGVPVTKFDSGA